MILTQFYPTSHLNTYFTKIHLTNYVTFVAEPAVPTQLLTKPVTRKDPEPVPSVSRLCSSSYMKAPTQLILEPTFDRLSCGFLLPITHTRAQTILTSKILLSCTKYVTRVVRSLLLCYLKTPTSCSPVRHNSARAV